MVTFGKVTNCPKYTSEEYHAFNLGHSAQEDEVALSVRRRRQRRQQQRRHAERGAELTGTWRWRRRRTWRAFAGFFSGLCRRSRSKHTGELSKEPLEEVEEVVEVVAVYARASSSVEVHSFTRGGLHHFSN